MRVPHSLVICLGLAAIVSGFAGCTAATRLPNTQGSMLRFLSSASWRSGTLTLVQVGRNASAGTYGDASELRVGPPSLYASAYWSCISSVEDLPKGYFTRTRQWLERLPDRRGTIVSSSSEQLGALQQMVLLGQVDACTGARLPQGWTADAVQRLSQSAPNVTALEQAAEALGSPASQDSATPVARRLAFTLRGYAFSVRSSEIPFQPPVARNGVIAPDVLALAGLQALHVPLDSSEIRSNSHVRTRLAEALTGLTRRVPTGPALAQWEILRKAAREVSYHLTLPPSYVRMLAMEQLPNGMFPLSPGHVYGDVQATWLAVQVLHEYGRSLLYRSALARTEFLQQDLHGGWIPSDLIVAEPTDTFPALAIRRDLDAPPLGDQLSRSGIAEWLYQLRGIAASRNYPSMSQRLSALAYAIPVFLSAREAGVSQPRLRRAALPFLKWKPWPAPTGEPTQDAALAKAMAYQSTIAQLADLRIPVHRKTALSLVRTLAYAADGGKVRLDVLVSVSLVAVLSGAGRGGVARILHDVELHRSSNGGYAVLATAAPDLYATRWALSIYALFHRRPPRQSQILSYVSSCHTSIGGFTFTPPIGRQAGDISLGSAWSGLYTVRFLTNQGSKVWHLGTAVDRMYDLT